MNISLIIPTWNGKNLLAINFPNVVKAVANYHNGTKEIIVVDDASTDDSVEFLKSHFPAVKIIALEKHSGFVNAVNNGVKNSKGEIIILLNNDVSPQGDFLSPLLNNFSDPVIFAVGCLEKSGEEGKEILSGKSIGWYKKGLIWHDRAKDQTVKGNTFWVAGGSGAFRKTIWEKLNGLDSLFAPFYWEDIDLSYRALKGGHKVIFDPESIVFHNHESTIGKSFSKREIREISIKNQILFFWKNITDPGLIIKNILWLPVLIVRSLIKGDTSYLSGILLAINQLPEVIKKRREAKKNFTKNDYEIL